MPRTEVMLIGSLPQQAGFPGAGGPIPPSIRFPYTQPNFRMNRHAAIPSTWMEPQDLLQVTDKTNYNPQARASGGRAIFAGVFSPLLFGRGMSKRRLGDAPDAGSPDPNDIKVVIHPAVIHPTPEISPVASYDAATLTTLQNEAYVYKSAWAMTAVSYSVLGAIMAGYHGSKRNHGSAGWTIGWGLLGAMFPLITNGVALAQGYGKSSGR